MPVLGLYVFGIIYRYSFVSAFFSLIILFFIVILGASGSSISFIFIARYTMF